MHALLNAAWYAAAALTGLIAGGLFTAVIHRLPRGNALLGTGFMCPYCRHPLALRDVIPIASYVRLRHGCRYCAAEISRHYPLAEGSTAALFLLCAIRFGIGFAAVAGFALCAALVICFFVDIEHRMVLDEVLAVCGVLALALNMCFGALCPWWEALIGIAAGAVPMLIASLLARPVVGRHAVSAGDVKFMAMTGAALGWKGVIVAYAFVLAGTAVALWILMPVGVIERGRRIPLIPALAGGTAIALFVWEPLLGWCFN